MDEDLRLFVRSVVRSVWGVEVLLRLRADSKRAWAPEDLAAELRSNAGLISVLLEAFVEAGLASSIGKSFFYSPAAEALDDLVVRLERDYRERPVKVIDAIFGAEDPVRTLADGFRFKGKSKP